MKQKKIIFIALATLIISGGFLARFWKLNVLPPGVHYDEAYNGLDALSAIETGKYKIFYPDNTGREGFHINAIALSIKIFGNTSLALRVPNAIWGSLTLVGFFFLLQALRFSRPAVLLGTFMLSFSFWHLDFSRLSYRAIMVPFCLVWLFYFFFRGMEEKRKIYRYSFFTIAGAFFGLGFNSYIAFRVAPLIFLPVLLYFSIAQKDFWKKNWKGALFFGGALFLAAFPMAVYFFSHQQEVMSRASSVSVFNVPGVSFSRALGKSLASHLGAFFAEGDRNFRQNYNGQPLLPAGWAAFLAAGMFISLREIWDFFRYRKRSSLSDASILAQAIFWVMLLPGILSIEGIPHSLRIIGVIPAVFLFNSLVVEYAWQFYGKVQKSQMEFGRQVGTIFFGLVLAILLGGFFQIYTYFVFWANDLRTYSGFERRLYNLGELVRDLPVHKNNYLVTSLNTNIFLDHRKSSLKTVEYLAYPKINQYLFYRPSENASFVSCDDPQIVFQESDGWLRDQFKGKCPNLKAERFSFEKGKYIFWVISSDPSKVILDEGVTIDDGTPKLEGGNVQDHEHN